MGGLVTRLALRSKDVPLPDSDPVDYRVVKRGHPSSNGISICVMNNRKVKKSQSNPRSNLEVLVLFDGEPLVDWDLDVNLNAILADSSKRLFLAKMYDTDYDHETGEIVAGHDPELTPIKQDRAVRWFRKCWEGYAGSDTSGLPRLLEIFAE